MSILKFLGSLNKNVIMEFQNLKCRIQYGDQKLKNCCILIKMSTLRLLGSLNPNPMTELQNSKWRI